MTTLYTTRARRRAAQSTLARLARWAELAGLRLVALKLAGAGRSLTAAWLDGLIDRLGEARRKVEAWVRGGEG